MRRRDLLIALSGLGLMPGIVRGRASAHEATPSLDGDADMLGDMLDLAPDVLAGPTPPSAQIAMYANPGLQLATMGEPSGGRDFSAWANATYWMRFPSGVGEFAREPRWRETFGFEARQVDEALEVGEPLNRVKLLRGRFDLDEVRAAWTASGYAQVELAGAEAFSWAAEPELDVESDVSQLGVGSMNNAAILPDGVLVFTGSLMDLEAAVQAASGDAPVLGARREIADVVTLLDPSWATGYIMTADAVRAPSIGDESDPVSDEEAAELSAQVAGSAMPRPTLIAVGTTAGGPWPQPTAEDATPRPLSSGAPQSETQIVLLFGDRGAAKTAASIVDARLTDGETIDGRIPYREFFPSWELHLDATSPALVILLDTSPDDRPGRIFDLLQRRDLLFIAWEE